MKKLSLLLAIVICLVVGHIVYYVSTSEDKEIAQRAFTVGAWEKCETGPSLYDRYISDVSYWYIKINKSVKTVVGKHNSLIKTALYVAKCKFDQVGFDVDTNNVSRGILLGLQRGEAIDLVWGGQSALHMGVYTHNVDLVKLLVNQGANVSVLTEHSFSHPKGLTALDLAIKLKSLENTPSLMQIIKYLKSVEGSNGKI